MLPTAKRMFCQYTSFGSTLRRCNNQKIAKTINIGDSLVVTHPTTSLTAHCLSTAERTGSPFFSVLWSIAEIISIKGLNKPFVRAHTDFSSHCPTNQRRALSTYHMLRHSASCLALRGYVLAPHGLGCQSELEARSNNMPRRCFYLTTINFQ